MEAVEDGVLADTLTQQEAGGISLCALETPGLGSVTGVLEPPVEISQEDVAVDTLTCQGKYCPTSLEHGVSSGLFENLEEELGDCDVWPGGRPVQESLWLSELRIARLPEGRSEWPSFSATYHLQ